MDIGKIHAPNPLGGGQDRARVSANGDAPQGQRGLNADIASISSGREAFASVEALTEKARGDGADRSQIVADAKARLESGELVFILPEQLREVAPVFSHRSALQPAALGQCPGLRHGVEVPDEFGP